MVITMFSETVLIRSLFKLGVPGFLVKNTDVDEIKDAISSVISGDLWEMQLILLLAQGKTSRTIADGLGLTVRTIEIYRSRVLEKAGVKNTSELLMHCHNNGII
jgi:DNA-binding NarL/FixJ family response regulator